MEDKTYTNSIHRIGRLSTLLIVICLLGAPTIFCMKHNCLPELSLMLQPLLAILVALTPTGLSEVFSYAPALGSASYITFITGNVVNLKFPVVVAAQEMAGVEANTPKADAVSTMAVALSSIETVVIICLGVLLMKPLQPVLQAPAFQTASNYIIPALFGGMGIGVLVKSGGNMKIERKWLVSLLPLVLIFAALMVIKGFTSYQGYAMILMIPVTIAWSYFLYKKGIVKIVDLRNAKKE